MKKQYPIAKKESFIHETHGHKREDFYHWMRLTDDQKNAISPDGHTQEVLTYLNDENNYTTSVLQPTEAIQETLYKEIVGRIKQDDTTVPYFKNGYWYYTKFEEGKEYPIHCRKQKDLDAEEIILLDVNELAEGKEYYQVSGLAVSPDNKVLAFGEDTVSRRVYTIRFIDLTTGSFLPDTIENASAEGAWANDNKTYFYTGKNKVSLLSETIWRHQLSTEQGIDELVYREENPSYYIGVYKSKSDDYIIIWNSSTLSSDYHILLAHDPKGKFQQFAPREEVHEYHIDHYEDQFYILTNWDAMNFRFMKTSVSATTKEHWTEVIGHRKDVLLEDFELFKNHIVITERSHALSQLTVLDGNGNIDHSISFDDPAYVVYAAKNPEFNTNLLRFGYSSLTTPNTVYEYDLNSKEQTVLKQSEVVGGHNPKDYQSERVFAKGRDGTKIPISLVYHKNTEISSDTPMLQYSYGSYGHSTDPWFNASRLSLLDRGFIWAIAHIRGGQEMGRTWYEDGKLLKKQNTFNDFIDCSKHLIAKEYTSSNHLYAMGGSAGGLLMGAIVNLAPDLYRGIIAAVPFVDVVSTMLDESIPLTTNEFDEWGNPKKKEYYDYMLSYSPYDKVEAQAYPNMLVTTGLHDSQVQYWEPAKWVAKLRDIKTDNNVLLLHTNMGAGHGGASGRFKRHKETALEYAYLLWLENQNNAV